MSKNLHFQRMYFNNFIKDCEINNENSMPKTFY